MLRQAIPAMVYGLLLNTPSAVRAQSPDSVIPPRLTNSREVSRTLDDAYPLELLHRGVGGVAPMRLFVNAEGKPDTVRLAASTGLIGLDRAARATALKTKFEPATANGETVAAWVDLSVEFKGDDHARNTPVAFTVLNRAELAKTFQPFYPPNLRREQIGTSVSMSLAVDESGRISERQIVERSCFDEANRAADALVRTVTFGPAADGTRQGWTYVTVTFNADSARLTLFGDTMPRDTTTRVPRDPDAPPPVARAPSLNNRSAVSRALVSHYPPQLRDRGVGGTTVVHFRVEEDGRVSHRMVSESSGICQLDVAALDVADIMRFDPALMDGEPVMVWVEIPIVFSSR